MKNTAKRSVVDWEIDFSTKVDELTYEKADVETIRTIKDILTAIGCLYTLNDKIDLSAYDADTPQYVPVVVYGKHKAFVGCFYKWVPDSKEVNKPNNYLELNNEFSIKDTRQISGSFKFVKIGASDDYAGTANEHHDTTTRSSFNNKSMSVEKYTTHCPGIKVLIRDANEKDYAWEYDFTILAKNEAVGYTLWVCQISILKNNFMTTDSYCKIVPLMELNDNVEKGNVN